MEENNLVINDEPTESKGALERIPPDDVMVIYPNPEKRGAVRLGLKEYMPLATSRILLSGPPGSGKRIVIMNLVSRMVPPPSICHVVHHNPSTTEYDFLGEWGIPTLVYGPHDFPTLENIEDPYDTKTKKEDGSGESSGEGQGLSCDDADDESSPPNDVLSNPLVIVDEVTAELLGKKGCSRFERMVNHVCTHKNTTLLCSAQSAASIPPAVRRGFNHFALWKQPDEMLNGILARRTSMTIDILNDLFELLRDPHEFIWIDMDSPFDSDWRYRVSMMSPIRVIPIDKNQTP